MAVIVYDMQAGVLRQLPDGGTEAVRRVSRLLAAARADVAAITPLLAGRPPGQAGI